MTTSTDHRDFAAEAETLKALASEVRVAVLHWLTDPLDHFTSHRDGDLSDDGGVCVSLIARRLGMSQPTVSRHLEILRRAGLIHTRRVANWNFHYRDEDGIARARHILDRL